MASYETMIQMGENAFRVPEKMQPKVVRKPLGDLTNSSKPQAKGKVPAKNPTGFMTREKLRPTVCRKPLSDVTNSSKSQAKERSMRHNNSKVKFHSGIEFEGFCHDHQHCVKAQNQCMSMECFLETVGLQKEVSAPVATTPNRHAATTASKLKLETPLKFLDDEIETVTWETPAAKSPLWYMDFKDSEFSGSKMKPDFFSFKLKESP